MKAVTLIACSLLVSCAVSRMGVSTRHINAMSPTELRSLDSITLCSAHANYARTNQNILEEMRRRDFSASEWAAIEARDVFVGMSEPALVCSWGLPGSCGDLNTTQFQDQPVMQYVYKNCEGYGLRVAYVKDGYVVGVQH